MDARSLPMFTTYRAIFSLLSGTAFLLAASGLHGLVLPLRGQAEGFSTASLGLLGTAWAGGFVAGCYFIPRLVRKVGHIRSFSALAASAAMIALMTGIWINETAWIVLRAGTGFAMAGAFMVIESWLNEKATNENRGRVFGLYMMVTYASIMGGQMLVAVFDVATADLFLIVGIFFCASVIPTAVSSAASPQPLADVKLDVPGLYKNSPVAAVGCLLVGVANGAWGTLGAVYGARAGLASGNVALMMSLVVLFGALAQVPVGRASDRTDRRYVLAAASFGAALCGLVMFLFMPRELAPILIITGLYGGLAYTLYSIAVAHANDHAKPEDFVKVSGGLLFLYGFGTMIGPLLGAALMGEMRPEGLFLATAAPHLALGAYSLLRVRLRAPVPIEDREAFLTLPSDRIGTPQSTLLDPRADADAATPAEEQPKPEAVSEAEPEETRPADAEA
jgi:MFS family permease